MYVGENEVTVTLPVDDVVEGDIAKRFWAMAREAIYDAWMEEAAKGYLDTVPEHLLMLCYLYDSAEFAVKKAAHDAKERARKELGAV